MREMVFLSYTEMQFGPQTVFDLRWLPWIRIFPINSFIANGNMIPLLSGC